ncbi:MAG: UDP-N-acetylmuramate dehydrogenase [Gammaproteobacteria bacterium]|jgi:UDP-N-acetylmuramate dehydrogenase|nr:UDP-N-acetylmuramate dehydrogenase [Gammaproteobacteria bacterium]MBT4654387.1 UDP-N-acetylmuramate dehydrogenase [Gammaproteobacteria bacterium]MBT5761864.1 UDP-N-acetylmuramate dehydrogenase [Gammaproteobacteria bacterium]MBT7932565.1 UDP-N-acetylmuramate dehydrogenase [Gammaproteobacteria bacterium]MDG2159150.1 UDP-N-acetylmuramate dehydrogenase [Gammaproteobacteria bacterium]
MIVQKNISLKKYTTIHIGGQSGNIYFPESIEDVSSLKSTLIDSRTIIIGKGSNIAFSDAGYKHDLISLNKFKKSSISVINKNTISVSSGISCARLAKLCYRKSIPGFEFLHGIPGTIGGALAMNAGSFNQSIWDCVKSVTIINKKGNIEIISSKNIKSSYRFVDKKNVLLFLEVLLNIDKKKNFDKKLLLKYTKHRNNTQPIGQWSSGCIFKNPSKKISASSLIDSLNISERKIGGIYISMKHCNYFINDGSGTCSDLIALINHVSKLVKKKYNIVLHKEICIYRGSHE